MNAFSCQYLAAIWLCLVSTLAQAHLLNMTEVRAEIGADPNTGEHYVLTLDLQLDLLAELGSAEAYYQFSQLTSEQILHQHGEMLERLASSIHLQQQSGTITPSIVHLVPPRDKDLGDFQNDFVWPMTDVKLQALLPSPQPIRIQFQTGFIFEEPIALSMHSGLNDKRKSRWLVAGQTSPVFVWTTELDSEGRQIASEFEASESISAATLWSYMQFGFLHILPYGWDHLLFVLMLYLSVSSIRQLIVRISLFTLAHSITLGMASYRIVEMPALLTEVLISLSILAVALLNLINKPFRQSAPELRYQDPKNLSANSLIFAFGLLHGLGFASSLGALDQPMEHFLLSLLSFNIGVELGQLAFLACLGLLIGRFKHQTVWYRRIVVALSALTGAVILFWAMRLLS